MMGKPVLSYFYVRQAYPEFYRFESGIKNFDPYVRWLQSLVGRYLSTVASKWALFRQPRFYLTVFQVAFQELPQEYVAVLMRSKL